MNLFGFLVFITQVSLLDLTVTTQIIIPIIVINHVILSYFIALHPIILVLFSLLIHLAVL